MITGENTHPELTLSVESDKLPKLYGGLCQCKASCVYSDKGPWSEVENNVNY